MDNNQPLQTNQPTQPVPQPPVFGSGTSAGMVATASVTAPVQQKKPLLLIVFLIIAGLTAVTFIGLFIWMYVQWDDVKTDVEGQIDAAVATAVNEKETEMENEFVEREKNPYNTFAGPADYGELAFEYPKTWSVYEAKDAANGGDYEAYLNPDKVYPVGTTTINALRVIIKDQAFDTYTKTYENNVKNSRLTIETRPIAGRNETLYVGEQPTSKLQGIAAVFKLRDKTVILQTDAMVFAEDYYKVLDTVRYNE